MWRLIRIRAKIQESVENGWTKPTKTMPPFEFADLSGKNLPPQESRTPGGLDLTVNIDDGLGLVAPFMKEKGAAGVWLRLRITRSSGHTQNWIVDTKGEWRWTGSPGEPDAKWEAAMLKQFESAK
jgi:hypothetical protein